MRLLSLILGLAALGASGYAATYGSWLLASVNALVGVLLLYAALDWKRVQ